MGKMRSNKPGATVPRLEHLRIADLIPHPDQDLYFPLYDGHQFEQLVRSVKAEKVKTPVDVLPAGNEAGLPGNTILCGHTRVKAAREAGLATVPAHVRYDLLGASRAEVDEIFLGDNTLRRQLSPLGQARAAVGIYRARKSRLGKTVRRSVFTDQSLRDEIGQIVGMSGRNLGRYLNVLEAPLEVQIAFEAGHVTLVQASRVVGLDPTQREKLAARLKAGEDAKRVFAEFFPPLDGRHVKVADAVAGFARTLVAARTDLDGRVGDVRPAQVRKHAPALRDGNTLIQQLLGKLDATG